MMVSYSFDGGSCCFFVRESILFFAFVYSSFIDGSFSVREHSEVQTLSAASRMSGSLRQDTSKQPSASRKQRIESSFRSYMSNFTKHVPFYKIDLPNVYMHRIYHLHNLDFCYRRQLALRSGQPLRNGFPILACLPSGDSLGYPAQSKSNKQF